MAEAKHLTDDTFETEVLQGKGVALVDFYADWCPPCKKQGPVVDELAEKYQGTIGVGKVNVDANNGISGDYQIRSIPTLIIFKNGQVAEKLIGFRPMGELEKSINKHLK